MQESATETEIARRRWPLIILAMAIALLSLFVLWANLSEDYSHFWASHIRQPSRFLIYDALTILCGSAGLIVSFLLHRCILRSRRVSKSLKIAICFFFVLLVVLLLGGLYLSDI